jgi:hypothetical protein
MREQLRMRAVYEKFIGAQVQAGKLRAPDPTPAPPYAGRLAVRSVLPAARHDARPIAERLTPSEQFEALLTKQAAAKIYADEATGLREWLKARGYVGPLDDALREAEDRARALETVLPKMRRLYALEGASARLQALCRQYDVDAIDINPRDDVLRQWFEADVEALAKRPILRPEQEQRLAAMREKLRRLKPGRKPRR